MQREKKCKFLPKKGKVLHFTDLNPEIPYLEDIAITLKAEFGRNRNANKEVMRWTGASERTVKYWFSGENGPGGEHLIALAAQSNAVMAMILRRSGRTVLRGALRLFQSREHLLELVALLSSNLD